MAALRLVKSLTFSIFSYESQKHFLSPYKVGITLVIFYKIGLELYSQKMEIELHLDLTNCHLISATQKKRCFENNAHINQEKV